MGSVSKAIPKPRVDDALAPLVKRKHQGEPADLFLFRKLGGEDGAAEWTYNDGAEWASKKLKKKIGFRAVYSWFQKKAAAEAQILFVEIAKETELRFLKENPEIDPVTLANAVSAVTMGQILARQNPEVAAKVLTAIAKVKHEFTEEAKLIQRKKEYEESVAKLKERLEKQNEELKKFGLSEDNINELNRKTVEEIDRMVEQNSRG